MSKLYINTICDTLVNFKQTSAVNSYDKISELHPEDKVDCAF